jgi:acetylornithine deacetylase/succinyl-diaminopimelate desuccinylase-like protein
VNQPSVTGFESIVKRIGDLPETLHGLQDVLLANLAMIAEIPAPTFAEDARAGFVQERFAELGYSDCSIDEVGNVAGVLPGSESTDGRNILLVAHTDTAVAATVDHTVVVQPDRVTGPSVADNALGLAAVAAMPTVLERLGLSLRSTVLGLACSRGLGRGNLEGVRFFLDHAKLPLQFGLCVEGVQLGRLSYTSIGMIRGEIACEVPEEYDWTRFGAGGAISTLNDIISRMLEIPTPDRPRTAIVLGRIEGGTSASTIATRAALQFEVRSESGATVRQLLQDISEIIEEVSSQTGADISMNIFARRRPGGIAFTHPLVRRTRRLMQSLSLVPRLSPSTSELSAFIDHRVPAVTVGLTSGEALGQPNETVRIAPIYTGLAQLLGIMLAMDGGYCE